VPVFFGITFRSRSLPASCSPFFSSPAPPDPIASFVTPDGPQYFIRTIRFRGADYRVPLDMTLLAEKTDRPVQVNITLPLDIAGGLETVTFHTDGDVLPVTALSRFYAEAESARYGGELTRPDFDRLRAYSGRPRLVVTSRAGTFDFSAPKEWPDRMATINRILD